MNKLILIIIPFIWFATCDRADNNITSKNINCNDITEKNAMPCCLQFMSSKTGSDSKDVVCRPFVDELVKEFAENRAKRKLLFCGGKIPESQIENLIKNTKDPKVKVNQKKVEKLILLEKFQSCWDKLNTK